MALVTLPPSSPTSENQVEGSTASRPFIILNVNVKSS